MESKRSCRKKHGYCEMNEDYPACPVLGAGKVPEAKESGPAHTDAARSQALPRDRR
jgi:hypothetical protein